MNIKDIIITVLSIISLLGITYGLYRYKRDLLFQIALKYAQEAENFLGSQKGQEKLKYVAEKIKEVTPWWIDPFISEKLLEKAINAAVDQLQEMFESSKEKQIAAVNEVLKLANTEGISVASQSVLTQIDSKGYVEGYAQVKSNLHGDNDVQAGVRAGIKF